MRSVRKRLAVAGVLALALGATAALPVTADAAKAKGKGGGSTSTKPKTATVTAGPVAVPDRLSAATNWGFVDIPLEIKGGKFKNKVVGLAEVTYGATGSIAGSVSNLLVQLSTPKGRPANLPVPTGPPTLTGFGPITATPDSITSMCQNPPTCNFNPNPQLPAPFVGRIFDGGMLASLEGIKMKGKWNLRVFDTVAGGTNTVNSIELKVKSAVPVQ